MAYYRQIGIRGTYCLKEKILRNFGGRCNSLPFFMHKRQIVPTVNAVKIYYRIYPDVCAAVYSNATIADGNGLAIYYILVYI